jgi:hypothetical protein
VVAGRRGWFWIAMGVLAVGVIVVGFGVLFLVVGLENAGRVSSGIGAAAGIVGLVVAGIGALRARSARTAGRAVGQGGEEAAVGMHATVSGRGRVYQAGRDQHIQG